MEKKKKESSNFLIGKILLIVVSVIVLLSTVWLGYSFYSMRKEEPTLQTLINLEDNILAQKAGIEFSRIEDRNYEYDFLVMLEEYEEKADSYVLKLLPFDFEEFYESRDEARFTVSLSKQGGKYDFSELEWEPFLLITNKYRVNLDMKYFFEYSMCMAKDFFGESSGECLVNRDVSEWEVVGISKGYSRGESLQFYIQTDDWLEDDLEVLPD
jgi:hypothetical protein